MTQIQYDVPGYYRVAHNGRDRMSLMQLAPNGPIEFGCFEPYMGGSPYLILHWEDWDRMLEWYSSPDAKNPDGTEKWPQMSHGLSMWDEVIGGGSPDPRPEYSLVNGNFPAFAADAWCHDGTEDAYTPGGSLRKRAEIVQWYMDLNNREIDPDPDAFVPDLGPRG